jgi:hypothetical protein
MTTEYRGCRIKPETLPQPILVAVRGVNQYRRKVYRVAFPDGSWVRCGSVRDSIRYVNLHGPRFGAKTS